MLIGDMVIGVSLETEHKNTKRLMTWQKSHQSHDSRNTTRQREAEHDARPSPWSNGLPKKENEKEEEEEEQEEKEERVQAE